MKNNKKGLAKKKTDRNTMLNEVGGAVWIDIKKDSPNDGEKVIIWQNNLSDKKCSRHHCAIFYKMKGGESFFDIYPQAFNLLYKSKNKFISGDLEGDKCQLTHWMKLPIPPLNDNIGIEIYERWKQKQKS